MREFATERRCLTFQNNSQKKSKNAEHSKKSNERQKKEKRATSVLDEHCVLDEYAREKKPFSNFFIIFLSKTAK